VWWISRRRRSAEYVGVDQVDEWLSFGRSRLHMNGHVVECDGVREKLTYREAKLLRLFVLHSGELLERDQILKEVWADEGVQVGRSVDMFVSRLRKKLKADPTIGIVAVHGVGYRMMKKEM
jgi:DNA-binding response OmpR family regulator